MIGLTKVYKSSVGGSKLAVDMLDLTMYSGQITALLGHNGAGKVCVIKSYIDPSLHNPPKHSSYVFPQVLKGCGCSYQHPP